ncbi:unnamed protein product [Cladocopium goreaui]|uniref:Ankyrin repeat and KH domain-containing protein 1 n=1 Tax=Cladocopium goreaui TaxID=2562237 RepID=A0A9P1CKA4_9DINO|nr:unnamed protein product [Cladocopium goreaui]
MRHGHSEANAAAETSFAAGQDLKAGLAISMATLTETGRWQAESLREQLKVLQQQEELPEVELVVSSPLPRAIETAKLIWPEKQMEILDSLRERLLLRPKDERPESLESAKRRAQSSFEWLCARPETTIAVVSHKWILQELLDPVRNRALRFCAGSSWNQPFEPFANCEMRAFAMDTLRTGSHAVELLRLRP